MSHAHRPDPLFVSITIRGNFFNYTKQYNFSKRELFTTYKSFDTAYGKNPGKSIDWTAAEERTPSRGGVTNFGQWRVTHRIQDIANSYGVSL